MKIIKEEDLINKLQEKGEEKEILTATINRKILQALKEYTNEKNIKISHLIEYLIAEFLGKYNYQKLNQQKGDFKKE